MTSRRRRLLRWVDPAALTTAAWSLVASRSVRRQLQRVGLPDIVVPAPPPLPDRGRSAVTAVLARSKATCLVRAAVLQRWDTAHGRRRDLVIGVTPPATGFQAHAWLEGDDPCPDEGFQELWRHQPPTISSTRSTARGRHSQRRG